MASTKKRSCATGLSSQSQGAEVAGGFHAVPGLKHKAGGAVLAVEAQFLLLEDAEGFGGVVGALHLGGVEDVAQLVAGQAIGAGIEGIELGPQPRPAVLVPGKGRSLVAQVPGEGRQCVGGVGELQHPGNEEGKARFGVEVGWQNGELLKIEVCQACPPDFLARNVIKNKRNEVHV